MFVGSYKHAIDVKGRINIPKRFLDHFRAPGEPRMFFATEGFEKCVFLFPADGWNAVVAQVRDNPLGSDEARAFSRRFYAATRELEVDSAGRILLPKELRDFAGIGGEALLVGVDARIEIWSPDRWSVEGDRHAPKYEEHAKGVFRA